MLLISKEAGNTQSPQRLSEEPVLEPGHISTSFLAMVYKKPSYKPSLSCRMGINIHILVVLFASYQAGRVYSAVFSGFNLVNRVIGTG